MPPLLCQKLKPLLYMALGQMMLCRYQMLGGQRSLRNDDDGLCAVEDGQEVRAEIKRKLLNQQAHYYQGEKISQWGSD